MDKNVRPPIVAILGHVDHGKTTLLDAIRKTNVAAREVGGITQKIGAYTIETTTRSAGSGQAGHKITFIDTPGHEAFQAMRGRGAKVADIALLVVAANEGAKPQTRESISLIKASKIPLIVAITKTDLPNANVDQVRSEIVSLGVLLEGSTGGGDVPVVPVSAKTGEGLSDLLEVISLVAELHGLPGKPEDALRSYVIESRQDARRGPVATVVVTSGQISLGDKLIAEKAVCKVRAITSGEGLMVERILPGMAGEILGFDISPPVGANVVRGARNEEKSPPPTFSRSKQADTGKRINLILKADTLGSLEALLGALPPDVGILSSGTGDINQNDIMLASSFDVPIIGFNVKVLPQVSDLVQKEKATIKLFNLIYQAIAWIVSPDEKVEKEDSILGKAEIRAEFPYGGEGRIAGISVVEGRITKGDRLRFLRDSAVVGESRIKTLHQGKKTVDVITKSGEGGILFRDRVDFKIGDVLESVR